MAFHQASLALGNAGKCALFSLSGYIFVKHLRTCQDKGKFYFIMYSVHLHVIYKFAETLTTSWEKRNVDLITQTGKTRKGAKHLMRVDFAS